MNLIMFANEIENSNRDINLTEWKELTFVWKSTYGVMLEYLSKFIQLLIY